MDTRAMLLVVLVGFIVMIYSNQQKFKNKMLCFFRRPNNQLIKKWVPLDSRWVIFDRGHQYGVERYIIDPNCISMMWYDEGLSKFYPVLIPTLEFRWDSPYPLDPRKFEITWQTPEAVNASFQSQQHIAFSKGAASQSGVKKRFPEWFFPAITIAAVLVVGYLVYNLQGTIDQLIRAVR